MYENRNFMIFSTSETGSIDFSEVLETSSETLRLSVDGSKSFVKWDGETIPTSVASLTTKEGPYTYTEIVTILAGSDWTDTTEEV
jgi:hypothetical protein